MKILNGRMITCVAGRYMFKMAEFPERCCITLVARCLLFYQYRLGSYHKNIKKDKQHLFVGPVEIQLSEKSSLEL